MVNEADADFMARALFHAARGRGQTSPNPVVGAVIVSGDGVVVGQGYHERAGGPHAEVRALEMAGERARGGTLYCTLEPCSHIGQTGPCVETIAAAGIRRVVAAMEDPNPRVRGSGFSALMSRGIRVDVGIGRAAAAELNQPFFCAIQAQRPFVTLKAAISADGCIADAPGHRTQLTSAAANRHAHRVRAEVDAIAVGVNTVIVDDPQLTPRGVYRDRPLMRVILDHGLRTPPRAQVLSTRAAGPVMIVTTPEAAAHPDRRATLEAGGAEIVIGDGTVATAAALLARRGVTSLLIEGGARLHRAAWDEGIVDFVRLYVSPYVIGRAGVPFLADRRLPPAALFHHRVEPIGPDVLIEGYVHRPR
jgi:diaminohydroxyphosphoribosylaminopyrimidine deaminase/5-amino-6-(5-phosphoribosylamino)uracil reductase